MGGQVCNPSTGGCEAPDYCVGVTCTKGQVCNPATGGCIDLPPTPTTTTTTTTTTNGNYLAHWLCGDENFAKGSYDQFAIPNSIQKTKEKSKEYCAEKATLRGCKAFFYQMYSNDKRMCGCYTGT